MKVTIVKSDVFVVMLNDQNLEDLAAVADFWELPDDTTLVSVFGNALTLLSAQVTAQVVNQKGGD